MLLTMPAMRVNASTADTGVRRDGRRADDMPSMVRTNEEFAISLGRDMPCASFRAISTTPERSETITMPERIKEND